MIKFIKLNNVIINTAKIIKINIYPQTYNIFINGPHIHGNFILGSGFLESTCNNIEICKHKNPNDYQIVKEWVDQINNKK